MFTGIIQDTGKISSRSQEGDSLCFAIAPSSKAFLKDVKAGDSIAVNGACMTAENVSSGSFEFTTIRESLKKTNLKLLKLNDLVNLEKAMTLNSKLDGHIVQGHVDATAIVKEIILNKDVKEFFIEFSSEYRNYIIPVGSIAVNGVSLTVAEIVRESSQNILIKVAIIPHTFGQTNFKMLNQNDVVNIEFDMLGKYVGRIFDKSKKKPAAK